MSNVLQGGLHNQHIILNYLDFSEIIKYKLHEKELHDYTRNIQYQGDWMIKLILMKLKYIDRYI